VSELVAALLGSSSGWAGGTPNGAQLRSTRAFVQAAEQDPELLSEAVMSLADVDPGAAAWIAVTCGTVVERGASAEVTGSAVFALLRSWLHRLPDGPQDDAQRALLELLGYLCQSVVTHLARLPEQRAALGQDQALLDRLASLQEYSPGAFWVHEALTKSSGTLVLLHPPSRAGVRVKYANVSNCFHLFSLLQTAVGTRLAGGREPDEVIARVARGQGNETVTDEAWWHYGNATSKEPDVAASIWGEGLVRDIPVIDGVTVVLAWPPQLKTRTWDAGFLGPHLEAMPADAVMEGSLTQAETDAWLARVGSDQRKRWWRFW
jgi:hypothetical protein